MQVIFKEKKFDQLLILFNNLLIILLSLLILLTVFKLISEDRIDNLSKELELLQGEELKYKSLLKDLAAAEQLKKTEYKKYNLLISIADYADEIIYNSLHFKNNKLKLKAVSEQQDMIFALIDALETDKKFKDVDLVNINQKENYNFELEILTVQ